MIEKKLQDLQLKLQNRAKLIAVTKKKSTEVIEEAYELGLRDFGENYVQELVEKEAQLPKDIRWHQIGYLQTNKVKYIAPFVYCIHSVASVKLAKEINKQAKKNNRIIPCLLQVHIAEEETKSGFTEAELLDFIQGQQIASFENIKFSGLMGMATFTNSQEQIKKEFKQLKQLFENIKNNYTTPNLQMKELSMGMSADWEIAVEEGSTMIRVGSSLFGARS